MRRLRGEGADSTFKGLNEGILGTVRSWEMRRESPEGQIVRLFFLCLVEELGLYPESGEVSGRGSGVT